MAGLTRNLQFLFFGSKHFGKEGYARAAATFDPSAAAARLEGRVCVVTGANQGLGLHTSEELARRGATLMMVCRNPERGQEAVDSVIALTGNKNVSLKVADVSSLASIQSFAQELNEAQQPVHVLIHNAGVLVNERSTSVDGNDISFATNTLGCFVLTMLLEARLKASAPSKVIWVSSGGMLTEPLRVDDLNNSRMGTKYNGMQAYSLDKRRQVALAERFAERWKDSGVSAYSMHPGWTKTEGVKKSIPGFYKMYQDKFRDLNQGTDTIVWLASQDDAKLTPGAFYLDRTVQEKHLSWGFGSTKYSSKDVDELWENLTKLAGSTLVMMR
mmetsp:Transcript_11529/g.20459  ORF Transcript_11529/g.20459 Transcript_11529/m.20459 type:complete len:329 (+) Transcript_11529:38-1024(+)